ncbi:MAG: diaminopimelate decarboxylase [Thermodesulfobacteriota bacterium]
MHHFHYKNGELHCEDVPLSRIASELGTPVYVYSTETLVRHFRAFDDAFQGTPHLVCFSAKSNSNLAILSLFGCLGGGVDIVSGGELYRALRAGIPPGRIVYSGVGKTEQEMDAAISSSILMFNIESSEELEVLEERARRLGQRARIAIRVNPDVDPQTHPYISTGLKKNKFGIDMERALEDYRRAARMEHLEVVGVDCHIGSQITRLAPFLDSLDRLREFMGRLRHQEGIQINYLDVGGGLGITYDQESPPHPVEYAKGIVELTRDLGCTLVLEPGRVLVGNAGVLLARVLYTKEGATKRFVIVDAAMNDLARPSLYGSYHRIQPVDENVLSAEEQVADLVGPICESTDFLAKDRRMPPLSRGDLVAVMSAGAYGFSMSSNYNSRPRAAEVLVRGRDYFVIRRRETYEDLISPECVPDWIRTPSMGKN